MKFNPWMLLQSLWSRVRALFSRAEPWSAWREPAGYECPPSTLGGGVVGQPLTYRVETETSPELAQQVQVLPVALVEVAEDGSTIAADDPRRRLVVEDAATERVETFFKKMGIQRG